MKTTTRKYIKDGDVFYDGISWGTPIGQVMFIWKNDFIDVYHDMKLILHTEYVSEARRHVNRLISKEIRNGE